MTAIRLRRSAFVTTLLSRTTTRATSSGSICNSSSDSSKKLFGNFQKQHNHRFLSSSASNNNNNNNNNNDDTSTAESTNVPSTRGSGVTMAAALANSSSRYGKLWGRSHETLDGGGGNSRRVLSVKGTGATQYLQGLVTIDMTKDPVPPKETNLDSPSPVVEFSKHVRAACFLDHRGRILTDAIVWKVPNNNSNNKKQGQEVIDEYLIDVPGESADMLLQHLKTHKLRRSKVKIADKSDQISVHVAYGTLNADGAPEEYMAAMDPRHPSLGMRVLSLKGGGTAQERKERFESLMKDQFPNLPGTYEVVRKLAGIAEGSEITGKTALECNQDWLNAVSFDKGCYLGQELTARSNFVGVIRKRIVPLIIIDTMVEVPRPWIMANMVQDLDVRQLSQSDVFEVDLSGFLPPPLPKISVAGAGGMSALLMGSVPPPPSPDSPQIMEDYKKIKAGADLLLEELNALCERGTELIDTEDGNQIGQILGRPAPGTSVVLAQMRLDRCGLMGDARVWKRTNKILIGDSPKKYRYLPYIPLWWPLVVTDEGRAKRGRNRQTRLGEKEEVIELPAEIDPSVINVPPSSSTTTSSSSSSPSSSSEASEDAKEQKQ